MCLHYAGQWCCSGEHNPILVEAEVAQREQNNRLAVNLDLTWQYLLTEFCHYTPSGKKNKKWMLRKATKVHVSVQCFSLFSKLERTSWSLTSQLDTVIIEVSSVKGLSLRGNTLRLYSAKHLPLINWTYGDTLAKLAILTWRYLYLLKMRICYFFLNHC